MRDLNKKIFSSNNIGMTKNKNLENVDESLSKMTKEELINLIKKERRLKNKPNSLASSDELSKIKVSRKIKSPGVLEQLSQEKSQNLYDDDIRKKSIVKKSHNLFIDDDDSMSNLDKKSQENHRISYLKLILKRLSYLVIIFLLIIKLSLVIK